MLNAQTRIRAVASHQKSKGNVSKGSSRPQERFFSEMQRIGRKQESITLITKEIDRIRGR